MRFSITFRYISKHNHNVTAIIGDSNTRYLKFGSSKGTFGDKMPGKRIECFTIEQIDPASCIGYQNLFIHCGINNIKHRNANVEEAAALLTTKLGTIRRLCPKAKIAVSPILPTKSPYLNRKAILFNKILFTYSKANPSIGTLDFNCFCDKSNNLSEKFGRYLNQSDSIHLGSTGIFVLSRLIARKLFSNPVDGRLYRDIANLGVNNQAGISSSNPRVSNSYHND